MHHDSELRAQLVNLLIVRQAHVDFEDVVANFPPEHINSKVQGCTYSFWHLLEHLRLCQKGILDYIVAETYNEPTFPDDYWPREDATTDLAGWNLTAQHFIADRQALVNIIQDPKMDLFSPLLNSGEHQHNIFREINIIALHNAYHTGELVILRKVMGTWHP